MNFYVSKDGQNYGPFTLEQIREQIQCGHYSMNDHGWKEGMTDWAPIGELILQETQTPPNIAMPTVHAGKAAMSLIEKKSKFLTLIIAATIAAVVAGGTAWHFEKAANKQRLVDDHKHLLEMYSKCKEFAERCMQLAKREKSSSNITLDILDNELSVKMNTKDGANIKDKLLAYRGILKDELICIGIVGELSIPEKREELHLTLEEAKVKMKEAINEIHEALKKDERVENEILAELKALKAKTDDKLIPITENTQPKPVLSESCKRYLDSYLLEAGKLNSMTGQGVSMSNLKEQLATVESSMQMVSDSWPSNFRPDIIENFNLSVEGYNLALKLWVCSNKYEASQDVLPTEPDMYEYENYIAYAKKYDGDGQCSLKFGKWGNDWGDTIVGKRFISGDNVVTIMGMAADYYKTGRKMLAKEQSNQ